MMSRFMMMCGMLAICMGVSASEYRDFLSADGKAIRGKVMRFDARARKVTILRDNKKIFTVPSHVFSDADQQYILEWEHNKVFLSSSSFKIEAKRKEIKDKDGSYSGSITSEKVENTAYAVTLENKSGSELKGLTLEYCVYYEQEKANRGKTLEEEGVRYGSIDVGACVDIYSGARCRLDLYFRPKEQDLGKGSRCLDSG